MKRVMVTGLGPVTPIGVGSRAYLEGQHEARNGIREITNFDADELSVRIAGETDVDISAYIPRKKARRLDRFVHFALIGTALAIEDAGLSEEEIAGEQTGTLIGTGIGGIDTWERESVVRFERHPMRMSPYFIPMLIANMASGHVAMRYNLLGPSSTVVTACSTGSGAIGDAFRMVQRGEADMMIAGGSEAPRHPHGHRRLRGDEGAVDPQRRSRNRQPPVQRLARRLRGGRGRRHRPARGVRACPPAGRTHLRRGGRLRHQRRRLPHHPPPHRAAPARWRCLRWAMRSADVNAEEIGYINAHGTSTPANDLNETLALKTVFGSAEQVPPVSSTKSMTGHMLGAAGGIEAIAAVQALDSCVLPPTRNLHDPDPELDLDYVPNEARELRVDYTLSQNFAFGGQNAALVFKRLS